MMNEEIINLQEQLKVSQERAKNIQFEGHLQVSAKQAKIVELEEQLRVSREQAKDLHRQEQRKVSQQQAKIIQLEKKLRASLEEVNVCENECADYLVSFHDAARRVATTQRQLQFRSDEIKRLHEEVEALLKYKQNYRERNVNSTWIMEVLDELESVTTKRTLINRLRDLIGRTLKMYCTQQDNAGDQGLQLRR